MRIKMEAKHQLAILKILEHDIRETSISGSHYNDETEIVKTKDGYILKVSRPMTTRMKPVLMKITPQMVLKWSEEHDGDYFGAYTEAMHDEVLGFLLRYSV